LLTPPPSPYLPAAPSQFGVLHDGATPYPGAAAALRRLRAAGCALLVLSNSSRRAAPTAEKLLRMFPETPLHAVTSGELARALLRSPRSPVRGAARVLHANWSGRGAISPADNAFAVAVASAGEVLADPAAVDAVVAHGTEAISICAAGRGGGGGGGGGGEPVQECAYGELERMVVAVARARPDVPFVCVNPDVVTVDGGVGLRPMPGALARAFEDAGGRNVVRMGKPGSPAYAAALERFAEMGIAKDEVVCVGDSSARASIALRCFYGETVG
jgi:ribonucleotide monophosphatase NagD (HAD superfamily)